MGLPGYTELLDPSTLPKPVEPVPVLAGDLDDITEDEARELAELMDD